MDVDVHFRFNQILKLAVLPVRRIRIFFSQNGRDFPSELIFKFLHGLEVLALSELYSGARYVVVNILPPLEFMDSNFNDLLTLNLRR